MMSEIAEREVRGELCSRLFVRMFAGQFAGLVESGLKRQTVRPLPKRMPRPGDKISLRAWEGKAYRSPQRVLREAVISRVVKIRIEEGRIWVAGETAIVKYPQRSSGDQTLDSFAAADGFAGWEEMRRWFGERYGLPFEGVLVCWGEDALPVLDGASDPATSLQLSNKTYFRKKYLH
jgi:hypothetical protein